MAALSSTRRLTTLMSHMRADGTSPSSHSGAACSASSPTTATSSVGVAGGQAVSSSSGTLSGKGMDTVANISEGRYSFPDDIEHSVLTPEQKTAYERDGFFVVKRLVPPEDLERYRQRFLDIGSGKVERPPTMTVMRDIALAKAGKGKELGESNITKLQNLQDDEVLFGFCKHPAIIPYVQSIVGPNVKSVHTMLINKPADVGLGSSRHPPHQDLWYFPFRPARRIVCAWTAMQKIDSENGCLFVKPGSHHGPLYRHEYPNDGVVNRAYHGIQNQSSEEDGKRLFHCEMEAGDTIFFHPLLIHGSGRNNSKGFRKAISCHYAASDCHYIPVDGTIQQEIAQEIEEMAKVKGVSISFEDIWRYTARLIVGKEHTL